MNATLTKPLAGFGAAWRAWADAGLSEQGKRQSPIDIVAAARRAPPALQCNRL
jgi:carbonic anhydrase